MLTAGKDRGVLIDLDTGKPVAGVLRCNLATGWLEACHLDAAGKPRRDAAGKLLTYQAVGRFRYVPRSAIIGERVRDGAAKCSRCPSKLTLPGDDLCPVCRAEQDPLKMARTGSGGARNRMRAEPIGSVLGARCSHPGCNRPAFWLVADEVEVSPSPGLFRGKRAKFSRGATVGRRSCCEFHWQPPRILDARGEVIRELDDGCGVRPT